MAPFFFFFFLMIFYKILRYFKYCIYKGVSINQVCCVNADRSLLFDPLYSHKQLNWRVFSLQAWIFDGLGGILVSVINMYV